MYVPPRLVFVCHEKAIKRVTSPFTVGQFHSSQQKVLIIFRGEHLLLPPLLFGHDLLYLGLLTKKHQRAFDFKLQNDFSSVTCYLVFYEPDFL